MEFVPDYSPQKRFCAGWDLSPLDFVPDDTLPKTVCAGWHLPHKHFVPDDNHIIHKSTLCERGPNAQNQVQQVLGWLCLMTLSSSTNAGRMYPADFSNPWKKGQVKGKPSGAGLCAGWHCHQAQTRTVLRCRCFCMRSIHKQLAFICFEPLEQWWQTPKSLGIPSMLCSSKSCFFFAKVWINYCPSTLKIVCPLAWMDSP